MAQVLEHLACPLQILANGLSDAIQDQRLWSQQLGGVTSAKTCRGMLDTAAWTPDAFVVLGGHFSGQVVVRPSRSSKLSKILSPAAFSSEQDFGAAVAAGAASEQHQAIQKYFRLKALNPGQAARI